MNLTNLNLVPKKWVLGISDFILVCSFWNKLSSLSLSLFLPPPSPSLPLSLYSILCVTLVSMLYHIFNLWKGYRLSSSIFPYSISIESAYLNILAKFEDWLCPKYQRSTRKFECGKKCKRIAWHGSIDTNFQD